MHGKYKLEITIKNVECIPRNVHVVRLGNNNVLVPTCGCNILNVLYLQTSGKIKMTDQNIIFKNNKTGKVDQLQASEMDLVNFQNFAGTYGIRIFLKNGTLHRFAGFKESEKDKIAKFFTNTYKKDMLEKELSLKGWNWGTAKFNGSVLSFDIGSNSAFEIPLNHVSQCNTGKNEITMEFHQVRSFSIWL